MNRLFEIVKCETCNIIFLRLDLEYMRIRELTFEMDDITRRQINHHIDIGHAVTRKLETEKIVQ